MFLGFSAGLPLALSGSTLLVWMRESRRRPRHHRAVRAGRHALHASSSCGRRWSTRSTSPVLSRAARPPPRLAGVLAASADRGDRVPRLLRSRARRRGWSRSARCWSPPRRRRRTSSSTPSASKASTRASRPPAWRPMSPPIASACWSRPPACCSWSRGFEDFGLRRRPPPGPAGYLAHGGAGGDRHRHDAGRDRAGEIRARPNAAHAGENSARRASRTAAYRRVLPTSSPATRRSSCCCSWCSSSSATPSPAP